DLGAVVQGHIPTTKIDQLCAKRKVQVKEGRALSHGFLLPGTESIAAHCSRKVSTPHLANRPGRTSNQTDDRKQPDQHQCQRWQSGTRPLTFAGHFKDAHGQRIPAKRAHEQSGGHFLEHIHEDQQCGAQRARDEQRQINPEKQSRAANAQTACSLRQRWANARQTVLERPVRDCNEPHQIGKHQRPQAAQQQRLAGTPQPAGERHDPFAVQITERQHDRHRQHRTRQRVADVSDADPGANGPSGREASGKYQNHCDAHRDQRSNGPQIKRVENQAGVTLIEVETTALPDPHDQLQQRHHKCAGEHQPTPCTGCSGFKPMQ
nr:hypothetical protein [Tanacetum cinerariifolium]